MREHARNFMHQRQSRKFQLREKQLQRTSETDGEMLLTLSSKGLLQEPFHKALPNPSDITSAPHWSRQVPQRCQRPCSPRLCLCGHQGAPLGQPGAAGERCVVLPHEKRCHQGVQGGRSLCTTGAAVTEDAG